LTGNVTAVCARVEFERLELNISSSGNVFKKGICKIGASIFRRSISNWLLKEARSHVAGVLNDAGVGVARRWSQEIDVGLGAWAVEVDLDRRLEFRIGSGVVFGGKLGLVRSMSSLMMTVYYTVYSN
jgi:hypothetical protein